MYSVKISKYDGPLDALLNLIEEKKLLINEISLNEVAEQFLSFADDFRNTSPAHLIYFLTIASALMLIKSRSLLPFLEIKKEEKEEIGDLERRLRELKFFRELAKKISLLVSKKQFMFLRPQGFQSAGFYPPDGIDAKTLAGHLKTLLRAFPEKDELPEKILAAIKTLEEKIKEITGRIEGGLNISLNSAVDKKSKLDVILGFLAVLELFKKGLIEIEQEAAFGEIKFKKSCLI